MQRARRPPSYIMGEHDGTGHCFHCANEFVLSALTPDHIPPRCVFPESAEPDIPTCGACRKCNKSWSRAEELFRDWLVDYALQGVNFPALSELREASARAALKRKNAGRRPSLVALRNRDVLMPGGFMTSGVFAEVNAADLNIVGCRIVNALYRHQLNNDLDGSARISSSFLAPNDGRCEMARFALAGSNLTQLGRIANGHLVYTWAVNEQDRRTSEWLFCFYGAVYFHGATYAPNVAFHSRFFNGLLNSPGSPLLSPIGKGS
jgi:hypothetical protein